MSARPSTVAELRELLDTLPADALVSVNVGGWCPSEGPVNPEPHVTHDATGQPYVFLYWSAA